MRRRGIAHRRLAELGLRAGVRDSGHAACGAIEGLGIRRRAENEARHVRCGASPVNRDQVPPGKLQGFFDVAQSEARVQELEEIMSADDFWNDRSRLRNFRVGPSAQAGRDLSKTESQLADLQGWPELGAEEDEETQALLLEELTADAEQFIGSLDVLELQAMLKNPQDKCNCILTVTQVLAVRKAVTGRICCCACTSAGANAAAGR